MQQILPRRRLPTYQRDMEYGSGQLVEKTPTFVREESVKEDLSGDKIIMGSVKSGYICEQAQPPTTTVLQPQTGSRGSGGGCISTKMAKEDIILLSTMETNSESFKAYKATTSGEGSANNTKLANPILVPDGHGDEAVGSTKVLQISKPGADRMAIIRKAMQSQGLREEETRFLEGYTRNNTARAYDNGWKKWVEWCEDRKVDSCEYEMKNIVDFLVHHNAYSTQHLNTLRSSIASVFKYIHTDKPPIASNQGIQDYFAAKRRKTVKIPSIHQMETWDTDLLVCFIRQQWYDNTTLTIDILQQKTIGLLCLATMARPRSDLGRLRYQDVTLRYGKDNYLRSAIIHFREAKETQVKSITLGTIADAPMCPVTTLEKFVKETATVRNSLPPGHTLFLAHVNDRDKVTSIRPSKLANWVKQLMTQAGVDSGFKAHSIRSASSTKAVERGSSIQSVKKHANWSLHTNTFESFYYKPTAANSSSTQITNSIFQTENLITLGAEAEETEIVVGTTNNQDVSEAEANNVIKAHPWYQFWKA